MTGWARVEQHVRTDICSAEWHKVDSVSAFTAGDAIGVTVASEVRDLEVALAVDGMVLVETHQHMTGTGACVIPSQSRMDPLVESIVVVAVPAGLHRLSLMARGTGSVHRYRLTMYYARPKESATT